MPRLVIPKELPTSPLSLFCPYCGAGPQKDCETVTNVVGLVHLSRIAAAAAIDAMNLDIRNENGNKAGKPRRK